MIVQPALFLVLAAATAAYADGSLALALLGVSFLVAAVLQLLWIGVHVRRAKIPVWAPEFRVREWLATTKFMLIVNVSQLAFTRLDILVVGLYLGVAQAGVYALCSRLGSLASMIANTYGDLVAYRFAQEHWSGERSRVLSIFRATTKVGWSSSIPVGAVLVLGSYPLLDFFGPEFTAGVWTLVAYTVGQVVGSCFGSVGHLCLMTGKEKAISQYTVLWAALAAAAYVLVIPAWGIAAAAGVSAAVVIGRNISAVLILSHSGYRVSELFPLATLKAP
jgi:O-antigen/teichoic acid export membrane protein